TVLSLGEQTVTATFTPTDAAKYRRATVPPSVTVVAASAQPVWTPTTPLVYGTTLAGALTAATSPVVAGGVSYAEGATAVTAATGPEGRGVGEGGSSPPAAAAH